MNTSTLYAILKETTTSLRKGPETTVDTSEGLTVVHHYAMPHESERRPSKSVDVHFFTVGVDMDAAEERRGDFIAVLDTYSQPERLVGGPSYIEVGAEVGSQQAALQMFGLGEALGLWDVITPKRLGIDGPMADELAGGGMVMMSGYGKK